MENIGGRSQAAREKAVQFRADYETTVDIPLTELSKQIKKLEEQRKVDMALAKELKDPVRIKEAEEAEYAALTAIAELEQKKRELEGKKKDLIN